MLTTLAIVYGLGMALGALHYASEAPPNVWTAPDFLFCTLGWPILFMHLSPTLSIIVLLVLGSIFGMVYL